MDQAQEHRGIMVSLQRLECVFHKSIVSPQSRGEVRSDAEALIGRRPSAYKTARSIAY